MNSEIESAMKALAKKIGDDTRPIDALQFTQALLNLAHAKVMLADCDKR
jgi:hypothetical protein